MDIINHQLIDGGNIIADLPRLPGDVVMKAWRVPVEYQASGFFVSTDNSIPACDHGEPAFEAKLEADAIEKAKFEGKLLIDRLSTAVQTHLDSVAALRGYGDERTAPATSIATYDNDSNPRFASDAAVFKAWRSVVWTHCYQVEADVRYGSRAVPTPDELLAELPILTWAV